MPHLRPSARKVRASIAASRSFRSMGIRSSLAASRRPLPDGSQLGWPCSGLSAPALRPRTTVLCFGWSFLSLLLVSINSRLHHLKHNGINQLGKSFTYLDFLARLHLARAPILPVRPNQRLLPLIQQPLKHPAATDTLAAVHAAQGHQRASAAWAGLPRG